MKTIFKQKKSAALTAVGLYALALAAVIIRSYIQGRNMKCRLLMLAICCILSSFTEIPKVSGISVPIVLCKTNAPLGADFTPVSKTQAAKLGIAGGVLVVKIYAGGTLSNQTKMREGFVITKIGGIPVSSVAELNAALRHQKVSFQIQGVYPGNKQVVYYDIHDF